MGTQDVMQRIAADLYEHDEDAFKRMFIGRLGSAPHRMWEAEDGWCIGYTTKRLYGGDHEGKFAAFTYKPVGKGARTRKAESWELVYWRPFASRKAAKRRAVELYFQHSPKACGDQTPKQRAAEVFTWF